MHKKYIIYTVILSFVACSTEMYLCVPGFPAMAEYFKTTESQIQATVSLNMLAFCIASLIIGSLSDSFGRKRLLYAGFILFCTCSVACVFANSLNSLLILRFLQGIGASTIWVISYAIIADLTEASEVMKYVSMLTAISTLAISLSPTIGSMLCSNFGWRSTFTCTAILSLIAFFTLMFILPETIRQHVKWRPKNIVSNYFKLMKSYQYMLHALTPSILHIPYMIFISCAPFMYMSILKLPYEIYGLHQSTVIAAYSLCSFNMKRLQNIFGEIVLQKIGLSLIIFSALVFVPAIRFYPSNPYLITACMTVAFVGMAICFCRVVAKTLGVFPDIRASASALMMTLRMSCCGFGVWLGGYLYTGYLIDTIQLIAITMCIGAVFYYLTIIAPSESIELQVADETG